MSTVLIADNDPGVRSLLAEVVRRQGLQVVVAEDGEVARVRLEAGGVDVLVCDLDMPRLPGEQLLSWLAGQQRQPRIIVVSGYVDDRSRADLERRPGVRAVLRKPFDVFAFARLVAELAAMKGGGADAEAPAPAGRDAEGAGENAQMA